MVKARVIKTGEEGSTGAFNTTSLFEVFFYCKEWMDTMFPEDLEVYIEAEQKWMSISQAFKEKALIPNNYNTHFAEPADEKDKERGYYD